MNSEIGYLLILIGFSCYFLSCKIWVDANNYFRLISDDEKRRSKIQYYSILVGILGFVLSTLGLMISGNTKYAFANEIEPINRIIESCMFLFYHSLFIWFNILVTRKYFYRYSISGEWKGNNHKITFYNYTEFSLRGIESRGEGKLEHINIGDVNTYKFWYSINYRKMIVNITWVEDYRKKEEIPSFVYFGNSSYRYKMKDNCYLFIDDSIGYMKRKS